MTDLYEDRSAYKDPDEVIDFKFDWSPWLNSLGDSDTIASSQWIADSGLTVDTDSNDTTSTTVWLSGGTARRTYNVVNRITTAGGRTTDRTMVVIMRDK